jgi:2-polyprenyl-6-methoxyphenol hydroxylase-like FAD-dependent oxidoreductase
MLAGFLVSDVRGWPETSNAMTIEGDYLTLVFPRPRGIARVYMAYAVENKDRFVGPTKVDDFRRALGEITTVPQIAAIADATPAGPLGSYPMNDSWLTAPLAPGVLLIGDAAGWSDPTIGQGLSVAMRDARIVSDILCSGDHWDFRPYADERAERMRQLRIALEIAVATRCDFTDRGRARRAEFNRRMLEHPELVLVSMTPVTGPSPENAAVYTDELLERVRAYGA